MQLQPETDVKRDGDGFGLGSGGHVLWLSEILAGFFEAGYFRQSAWPELDELQAEYLSHGERPRTAREKVMVPSGFLAHVFESQEPELHTAIHDLLAAELRSSLWVTEAYAGFKQADVVEDIQVLRGRAVLFYGTEVITGEKTLVAQARLLTRLCQDYGGGLGLMMRQDLEQTKMKCEAVGMGWEIPGATQVERCVA